MGAVCGLTSLHNFDDEAALVPFSRGTVVNEYFPLEARLEPGDPQVLKLFRKDIRFECSSSYIFARHPASLSFGLVSFCFAGASLTPMSNMEGLIPEL
jgi:hypothetical protein